MQQGETPHLKANSLGDMRNMLERVQLAAGAMHLRMQTELANVYTALFAGHWPARVLMLIRQYGLQHRLASPVVHECVLCVGWGGQGRGLQRSMQLIMHT